MAARLAIWERNNHAGTPPDLSHDPLQRIIGADLLPVDVGKGVVCQRFGHAAVDQIRRRVHSGAAKLLDDCARLAIGCIPTLLGMDGFEHVGNRADLGGWHMAEDVAVKMNHTALPSSFGQMPFSARPTLVLARRLL